MGKERRDVVKSREAIKQAFIKLNISQDTNKITVNKILELANVSRGTFYAHFQDIYDVQKQVEDDLLSVCISLMQADDIYKIVENPYPQILKSVIFFQEHADIFRNLSNGQNSFFFSRYKKILLKGIQESSHTVEDNETAALLDACIVGAIVDGCLEMVLQGNDKVINPEVTAQIISRFISQGILGFGKKD